MSVAQITKLLASSPPINTRPAAVQPKHEFFFIYGNHYSHSEFSNMFPNAVYKGATSLHGWQWHINKLGKPNLRMVFSPGGIPLLSDDQILPAPTRGSAQRDPVFFGAMGYIFQVSKDDDDIHQYMGMQGYHEISQNVSVIDKRLGPDGNVIRSAVRLEVTVYVDLRNTCEGGISIVKENVEKEAWVKGLRQLEEAGTPNWYTQKIFQKLVGLWAEVEPIYISRELKFSANLAVEMKRFDRELRQHAGFFDRGLMNPEARERLAEANRLRDRARQAKLAVYAMQAVKEMGGSKHRVEATREEEVFVNANTTKRQQIDHGRKENDENEDDENNKNDENDEDDEDEIMASCLAALAQQQKKIRFTGVLPDE